jgi:hypothetical protein
MGLSAAEQMRTDEGTLGAVIDPTNLVCIRFDGPFLRAVSSQRVQSIEGRYISLVRQLLEEYNSLKLP